MEKVIHTRTIDISQVKDQSFTPTQTSPTVKLTDWKNEPELKVLTENYQSAKPSHDLQVIKIKEWTNLLTVEGKAKPKSLPNRSSVQPKLIRKQAEWRYSALSEPFLGSDKLFNIEPVTWEDVYGAQQNELVLNWQFRTKINTIKFIDELVRTNVDEGTAIVKIGWDRQTKTEKKIVPVFMYTPIDVNDQENMAILTKAMTMKDENPRGFSDLPEQLQAAVEFSIQNNLPFLAQYSRKEEEIEEEVIITNEPTLQILNNENVFIDPSCEGDIRNARFAIISFETSKSELLKDGRYKNLDKINLEDAAILNAEDHVTNTPTDFNFKDDARKRIVAYEYWGYYDIDGTGIVEPFVATWVGNTLIRMERNPFPDQAIPLVVINYMPVKRSVYGEPDASLLGDNQAILGALTRGLIDLMGRSANGQIGYARGMLDVTNRRKFERGENYEFNPQQNVQNMLLEHKYPEIPQSALIMIQNQNLEAESITGVKSFTGGLSGESYGQVAAGIRGVLDAASKREMAILRRIAKGIKEIGIKIIAMNSMFLSESEVIRVTNSQFITVKREDLKGNFDLKVDISTAEVDNAKAQDLGFMLQTIGPNMPMDQRNRILAEIATLKRMPALAHDLLTYKPEPDPIEEQLKQLAIQKAQLENQQLQSKIMVDQSTIALNEAKIRELGSKADMADLNFVEQETGTKHARDMEKQRGQAEGNQNLEITKALLKDRKPEDKPGDVEAAIGFNRITDALTPLSRSNI